MAYVSPITGAEVRTPSADLELVPYLFPVRILLEACAQGRRGALVSSACLGTLAAVLWFFIRRRSVLLPCSWRTRIWTRGPFAAAVLLTWLAVDPLLQVAGVAAALVSLAVIVRMEERLTVDVT